MYADTEEPEMNRLQAVTLPSGILDEFDRSVPDEYKKMHTEFQHGGESNAWELLESFVHDRCVKYNDSISAPGPSRSGCSRLSPHITWGNISIRQIIRYLNEHYHDAPGKRGVMSFTSRLKWHCHFVQKFESEPRIEFENMNRGYDDIRNEWDEEKCEA